MKHTYLRYDQLRRGQSVTVLIAATGETVPGKVLAKEPRSTLGGKRAAVEFRWKNKTYIKRPVYDERHLRFIGPATIIQNP